MIGDISGVVLMFLLDSELQRGSHKIEEKQESGVGWEKKRLDCDAGGEGRRKTVEER